MVCECCDYTDDDESEPDENGGEQLSLNDDETTTTCDEKQQRAKLEKNELFEGTDGVKEPPVKVQPGWYGKGCKKIFRKKKRN